MINRRRAPSGQAFSLQTIEALAQIITGGRPSSGEDALGMYRSGTEIKRFFMRLNLELVVGSRVPSVIELLERVNMEHDGRERMAQVIEQAVDVRDYVDQPDHLLRVIEYLNRRLRLDGYEVRLQGQKYGLIGISTNAPVTTALKEKASSLRLESVRDDFERALAEAENDPEDAVTSACSTVESVCKCLLDEMGQAYPSKQDISGLVKTVQNHLNLSPARTDLPSELAHDIKTILGGIATVAQGIGALRTHGGDAHGRGKVSRRLDSRIARLAIHGASTISLFFIETWQKQRAQSTQRP